MFVCIILFFLFIELRLSMPARHLLFQAFAWVSPLLSCLFLLPFTLRVFIKAESYYTLRVTAIDHRLGLSGGKGGTVWCGGVFFSPLFLHMCVCWESSCVGVAGGGVILEESVSCPRMHVGLPWVNPPTVYVCVCVYLCVCVSVCEYVCLQFVWVRALLLSLVLIKEAFELVSRTTSAVAGDEKCSQTRGY